MSKMLYKMNLISVVQQLPKDDIETIQGYIEMIEEENQELKETISSILNNNGFKFKNNNGEIVFELNDNVKCLEKENQKLKRQLEKYETANKVLSQELTKDKMLQQDHLTTCCGIPIGDIPKLISQQKEFIKYLEDKINFYKINTQGYSMNLIEEILQKYKEIIGDDK